MLDKYSTIVQVDPYAKYKNRINEDACLPTYMRYATIIIMILFLFLFFKFYDYPPYSHLSIVCFVCFVHSGSLCRIKYIFSNFTSHWVFPVSIFTLPLSTKKFFLCFRLQNVNYRVFLCGLLQEFYVAPFFTISFRFAV